MSSVVVVNPGCEGLLCAPCVVATGSTILACRVAAVFALILIIVGPIGMTQHFLAEGLAWTFIALGIAGVLLACSTGVKHVAFAT